MDLEIKCDFYSGDKLASPIKSIDFQELKGFKKILKNKFLLGNFYWQKGAISLVFQPYSTFIITGEPYCLSTWVILILSRFQGKKTILWSHGWYGNESAIKQVVKRIFFNLSSKILLYGNHAKAMMAEKGIKREKMETIYNSLDYDKQVSIREKQKVSHIYENHFGNKFPTLIYIGRIQRRKKIELLIEAMGELKEKDVHCNLILIGGQTEELDVYHLIKLNDLNNRVWNYGSCYDEEVLGELLFNASVCVSPGNVGLTAMHCLVYGTPCITQNNFSKQMPEFEAIETNLTGDFFEEDSISDLARKIHKWITITEGKRELVRDACYHMIASKYNPHIQLEILKKAIGSIN